MEVILRPRIMVLDDIYPVVEPGTPLTISQAQNTGEIDKNTWFFKEKFSIFTGKSHVFKGKSRVFKGKTPIFKGKKIFSTTNTPKAALIQLQTEI